MDNIVNYPSMDREYEIPPDLLHFGKKNLIAVRVYDQQGSGGIYQGPVGLFSRPEIDKLLLTHISGFWKFNSGDNLLWAAPDFDDWAAWALGEIGAKETIEPLIYCLEEREDCDYYQVGMALRKLDSNRSVDAFIAGMVKGAWWAQSACTIALGETQSEKAIDPLINALKEGSEQVRRAAVFALQNYKIEKVINALREATKDSDMEVRMYAREALKKINSP